MRTGLSLFPMVLVVVLVSGCSAQAPAASLARSSPSDSASSLPAGGQPNASGFATPEEAIRQYMAGVAHADLNMILRACAIDEMSVGFRFDLFAERLNAFTFQTTNVAPSDYPFYIAMNRALRAGQILHETEMLAFSLLSSEQIDGNVITPVDKARAERFVRQVDPSRLAGLTIADLRFPNAKLANDARYLANAAIQARIFGADEMTERLVLFSFEDKLYEVGFSLLRYAATWKVSDQVSSIAGTSTLGTAQPTSIEEFDRVTSGS